MTNWKRVVGQKMRSVSPELAKNILSSLNPNIGNENIKTLTGGYSSQAIDAYVIRKLGIKAGLIK